MSVTLAPGEGLPGALGVSFASNASGEAEPTGAGVNWWPEGQPDDIRFAAARATHYRHESLYGLYVSEWHLHAVLETEPGQAVSFSPCADAADCAAAAAPRPPGSADPVTFTARSPPLASALGGGVAPMRLGMLGDLGQTEHSNDTMRGLMSHADDLASVILVGDLSYADYFNPRWDSWSRVMEEYLGSIPFLFIPGNHEIETDSNSGRSFVPYAHRFQMDPLCHTRPGGCMGGYSDPDGWRANLWYSMDIGPAHFLYINNYWDKELSDREGQGAGGEAGADADAEGRAHARQTTEQWVLQTVIADLQAVNRTLTPWVVLCMHAPFYNSNDFHQNEREMVVSRALLETVVKEYDVNIVFAGHVHSYERMNPVYKNQTGEGPVYINIGDAGNREGLYDHWLPGEDGADRPSWSAFRKGSYGYGVIEFRNATHALWEWHSNPEPEESPGGASAPGRHLRDQAWIENHVQGDPVGLAGGEGVLWRSMNALLGDEDAATALSGHLCPEGEYKCEWPEPEQPPAAEKRRPPSRGVMAALVLLTALVAGLSVALALMLRRAKGRGQWEKLNLDLEVENAVIRR